MGVYLKTRHLCFALIIVALVRTGAVDVYLDELVDYNGIKVLPVQASLYSCMRHQPRDGSLVTRVVIGRDVQALPLSTPAPYIDVMSLGARKYFKIENSEWSAATPFIGNKYKYYRVLDNEIFPCSGSEYMVIYRDTFSRRNTVNIWRDQKKVERLETSQGRFSIPQSGIFICRVGAHKHTLWEYEEDKGIVFVKACNRRMCFQTVATLYFKDLNDNEITLNYVIWPSPPTQLLPWKGYPGYDAPPERLPSAFVHPRLEPIPLIVNITRDTTDSPLLKVHKYNQEDRCTTVYVTHPNAFIKKFISPQFKRDFAKSTIFFTAYHRGRGCSQLQVLLYEENATVLFEMTSDNTQNGFSIVTDPSVLVHTFPLYLEAEVDERMYTRTEIVIEGIESVVYTARPHLAFSQVYHGGESVFADGEPKVPIQQYIL